MSSDPWTEDEDFYLSEGYALFHDEKINFWDKILALFPFKPTRTSDELQERWRFLTDQLETESQATLERIKSASKLHAQTWSYNYEPTPPSFDSQQIIDEFKRLPSLAMKTQVIEMNARSTTESQNMNEMCLNNQFDASSVRKIVQDVLNKTVDDETLRTTLIEGFKRELAQKGREFAYHDIKRKLKIINEMTEQQAEIEVAILLQYFQDIFDSMIRRIGGSQTLTIFKVIEDSAKVLKTLYEVVKISGNINPPLKTFYREFIQKFYKTIGTIFNNYLSFQPNNNEQYQAVFKLLADFIVVEDKNHEIDKYLHQQYQQNIYLLKYREQYENSHQMY